MLQDFPDAPLFITQGRMPTENAPFIPLPQANVSGTDSYTTNGVYPTFDERQAWTTTTLESIHWGGIHGPRPPNVNASFFPGERFHVSLPSPVSSNSASSIPSPTFTTLPPRPMGTSATGYPMFTAFHPSQMCASATGCHGARINGESNTYVSIQDTFQFLDQPQNDKGDRSTLYTAKTVPQTAISKYTVLGCIQEIGNGVSAMDALESIASLIEAEPLPSRGQTINELRMRAVQQVCGAFDALKRTGSFPRSVATTNDDSAVLEARAGEAARLLMGLINLGIMKPGDLTIPVKIIFESDRRYMYLAKAILENSKCLAFTYTAVKWLQSMAADLQDAEDVKYIIRQIKTPPRPHRRW